MILIIDCGSQTTHLIARRIKALGRPTLITTPTSSLDTLAKHPEITHIVLSGGPRSVYEPDAPHIDVSLYTKGLPMLGICYGMQLIAHDLGGTVSPGSTYELGSADIIAQSSSRLFGTGAHTVWMNHGDFVSVLPPGFLSTAHTSQIPHAVIEDHTRHIYGVQFHPEVTHTPQGVDMLASFLDITDAESIKHAKNQHITTAYTNALVQSIRTSIPSDSQVICALSGGVDSSVAALAVHKAIGTRLTCVYIDSGLMRQDETRDLRSRFQSDHLTIHIVDAADEFFMALAGVIDPEAKRKAIGRTFIRVLEKEAKKIGASYLVQGTIYPDVIESAGSTHASTIKSHHNVGGLPADMKLTLVEPLRELYKDEVRQVGKLLGMDLSVLKRHPYPGPGLAIRIIGEVTRQKVDVVRQANAIIEEEIQKTEYAQRLWQFFAILTGVSTTGIRGDARAYGDTIAIRAVESIDVMSATAAELPYELLFHLSRRITTEVKGVNRVVYDITSKPPGTIEWE